MTEEQEERLRQAFTYQLSVELARMKVQMRPPGMAVVGREWLRLRANCPDYEAGRINEYKAAFPAARAAAERLRREGFTIPARYISVRPWQYTGKRKGVSS